MIAKNWNCDNDKCREAHGEVRVLPTGYVPWMVADSNAILCHACYEYEMAYRRDRNKSLGEFAHFALPEWEDLKIYVEEV